MQDSTAPIDLLTTLEALGRSISGDLSLVEDDLSEQRRQAHASATRRRRDAAQYALGNTFMLLGFDECDATTLLGLFVHPDKALRWLVEARVAQGSANFATLLGQVLSDPARAEWCRDWGVYLRWAKQKQLYDAEVTSFITSGRAGPKAKWRRDPVSVGQAYLIDLVCELKRVSSPEAKTKGEAFEWLREMGGNPRYSAPPDTPPWERWS